MANKGGFWWGFGLAMSIMVMAFVAFTEGGDVRCKHLGAKGELLVCATGHIAQVRS